MIASAIGGSKQAFGETDAFQYFVGGVPIVSLTLSECENRKSHNLWVVGEMMQ